MPGLALSASLLARALTQRPSPQVQPQATRTPALNPPACRLRAAESAPGYTEIRVIMMPRVPHPMRQHSLRPGYRDYVT